MQFDLPPPRRSGENILPMINVVFLLLIFFLISAQLTPPEPFAVEPPVSEAERHAEGDFILHLAPGGQVGYRDSLGVEAALAALGVDLEAFCASGCDERPPLLVRADAATPAADLARLMPRLGPLGFSRVDLVTVPR